MRALIRTPHFWTAIIGIPRPALQAQVSSADASSFQTCFPYSRHLPYSQLGVIIQQVKESSFQTQYSKSRPNKRITFVHKSKATLVWFSLASIRSWASKSWCLLGGGQWGEEHLKLDGICLIWTAQCKQPRKRLLALKGWGMGKASMGHAWTLLELLSHTGFVHWDGDEGRAMCARENGGPTG